jgi:hypothetical protein
LGPRTLECVAKDFEREPEEMQGISVNDRTLQARAGFCTRARQRAVVALCIVVIGMGALTGAAALWRGATGVRWALMAVAICGAAGLLSLVANRFARGPQAALLTMLIGMGIRMSAALTACLIVNSIWRDGIEAGFGWYLVAAYLITLALDIIFLANPAQMQTRAGVTMSVVQPSGMSRGGLLPESERHG